MSDNNMECAVELGAWLGRRQAFSMVAGRCSAADAECLRDLRESKKYKLLGLTWEECCKQRAGIPRSTADQIIRHLEEFGADYFAIAQLTGISADEYRRLRASISNRSLLYSGDSIPILVENAPRLIAAIEAFRRENALTAASPGICFAKAERALRTALTELDRLRAMPLDTDGLARLQSTIGEAIARLKLLDPQIVV